MPKRKQNKNYNNWIEVKTRKKAHCECFNTLFNHSSFISMDVISQHLLTTIYYTMNYVIVLFLCWFSISIGGTCNWLFFFSRRNEEEIGINTQQNKKKRKSDALLCECENEREEKKIVIDFHSSFFTPTPSFVYCVCDMRAINL